eukprot:SAG31_NODE_30252_length_383_cov_1.257042_1_plen_29_part_10
MIIFGLRVLQAREARLWAQLNAQREEKEA